MALKSKAFSIGNVQIENPLILAPMAGVSDIPFRLLCKEQGCALVYTEMISAKAIYYGNRNTKALMQIDEGEHPVTLQLFGSEPKLMGEMAKRIEDQPFDILDINMGCPVPKVVRSGEGSALMKDPLLVGRIIETVASSIQKPVTVKIRKGFDGQHVNAVEIARIAQESGAAAIAVHGRTRSQYYDGKADWDIIRQVKEAVRIPVIGNGDVDSASDAEEMMCQTGCDGVMIGRGARGNPWIFRQILYYLETGASLQRPDLEEVVTMILRHARMQVHLKGEKPGILQMRKHVGWYTVGYPDSSQIRQKAMHVETYQELEELLIGYLEKEKNQVDS